MILFLPTLLHPSLIAKGATIFDLAHLVHE